MKSQGSQFWKFTKAKVASFAVDKNIQLGAVYGFGVLTLNKAIFWVELYVVKDNYCVHWLYPGPNNKGHTLVDQSCSGQNIQQATSSLLDS